MLYFTEFFFSVKTHGCSSQTWEFHASKLLYRSRIERMSWKINELQQPQTMVWWIKFAFNGLTGTRVKEVYKTFTFFKQKNIIFLWKKCSNIILNADIISCVSALDVFHFSLNNFCCYFYFFVLPMQIKRLLSSFTVLNVSLLLVILSYKNWAYRRHRNKNFIYQN